MNFFNLKVILSILRIIELLNVLLQFFMEIEQFLRNAHTLIFKRCIIFLVLSIFYYFNYKLNIFIYKYLYIIYLYINIFNEICGDYYIPVICKIIFYRTLYQGNLK